jgi:hypothetical protein
MSFSILLVAIGWNRVTSHVQDCAISTQRYTKWLVETGRDLFPHQQESSRVFSPYLPTLTTLTVASLVPCQSRKHASTVDHWSLTCSVVTLGLFHEINQGDLLETNTKVCEYNQFTFTELSRSSGTIFTTEFLNRVRISFGPSTIVSETSRGFPQPIQENVRIVLWNRLRLLASTHFQFIIH